MGELHGHLWRDAAPAVDQFGERGTRDAQGPRRLRDGKAERLDSLAENNAAGMRRILFRYGKSSLACLQSSEQQCKEGQGDHLQTGIEFAFAVVP
jgi:hypothetical protein